MIIQNSSEEDIAEIFRLYEVATQFQKSKLIAPWPIFERALIETEIEENRQWKMLINGEIACIWATTFSDPQIWEARNADPAVYMHRIATNPNFRGQNLVREIVSWARTYAKEFHKKYIRLDTIGGNSGLINHYQKCGFEYLGLFKPQSASGLPLHYKDATLSLFEIITD
jgi:ribosomal protein S18 acetylase RimI-like enzyme